MYTIKGKQGRVHDESIVNAMVVFRKDPAWAGVIAYDERAQDLVTRKPPPWLDVCSPDEVKPGPWTDNDTTRARDYLRRKWSITLGKNETTDAIAAVADAQSFDPVKDWIDVLPWDGFSRVGRVATENEPGVPGWMHTYMHAEDTPYTRLISRLHAIASVARVYEPGEKVDTVPIAESPEGKKKGQLLEAMYWPWYTDTPVDLNSKDRFEVLFGIWAIELAEFDQYSRHEASVMKSFASSRIDRFRRAYARCVTKNPRRCVPIASVNPGKPYFNDEGAGRRWQPFKANIGGRACEVLRMQDEREQLWAEARELYFAYVRSRPNIIVDVLRQRPGVNGVADPAESCRWWPETPEEKALCAGEVDARKSFDVWFNGIAAYVAHHRPGAIIKSEDILSGHLNIERGKWTEKEKQRVEKCLRQLGWLNGRASVADASGHRPTHYYLPVTP